MQCKMWVGVILSTIGAISSVRAQDNWCGKVYQAGRGYAILGGILSQPEPSSSPLLDVQITPRHSIYVGSETTAEFIVDARLSPYHGSPYVSGSHGSNGSDSLLFTVGTGGNVLVAGSVAINTTDNLFKFDLTQLQPQATPYQVTLSAATSSSSVNYTSSTSLFYLPEKSKGSAVKVDKLYGSLLYRNDFTHGTFQPVFPYGFYGSYDGYLNVSDANVGSYSANGFNAINPVVAFTDGDISPTINKMDELNLLFQYDMRGSYQNLTSVAQQVPLVKDHPSLLTYYTADEPDGWSYALNSTKLSYHLLASMDKYHPTALVLNCQNYFYEEYASGADIIMEDAYPVGINATYSKWDTVCNATYGDCGCDNCIGSLVDVPSRIDDLYKYQSWLGGSAMRKPVWSVPQVFSGEGYWSRDPTPEEVWAMDLMAFNHGAKGRLAWIYPPSELLIDAASQLAKVVTVAPVMDFLTGANPVLLLDGKAGGLDVAYWQLDKQVLVGVVNPMNKTVMSVDIHLPAGFEEMQVNSEPWGSTGWRLNGSTLVIERSLPGLTTSYVILQ